MALQSRQRVPQTEASTVLSAGAVCAGARVSTSQGAGTSEARWMTGLTQDIADLPDREDSEKAGDARTDCEHCQLVCVQLGNVLDRHVRLLGQGFDGALVRGAVERLRRRGKPVHRSLS